MNEAEELAKKRFVILNLVRLVAVAIVLGGVTNIAGKWAPDLSPVLGYALLIFGAADFFIAPVFLKRMWRTPDA